MALARAFTKKDKTSPKVDISGPMPSPSFLRPKPKHPGGGSIRNKISGPTALISSTNQLAYNAPDLFPKGGKSNLIITTTSPTSPVDEHDVPDLSHSTSATPDSSTRGSTPVSEAVEPNHLSGYFDGSKKAPLADHAPSRSRSGSQNASLLRKKSESRVRSPTASEHDVNRKPSLSSTQSGSTVPSWMSEGMRKTSTSTTRSTPPGTPQFTPLTGNTNPSLGAGLGSSQGGLGRKNTVRARGSIDMFMPGNGLDSTASNNDLRSKASRGNMRPQQPTQQTPPLGHPATRPSQPTPVHPAQRPSMDRERERERQPRPVASAPSLKADANANPFGNELAQVTELAEDFGIGRQVKKLDEEEREMQRRKLRKFTANDYMGEIQGLFDSLIGSVGSGAMEKVEGGLKKQVWI